MYILMLPDSIATQFPTTKPSRITLASSDQMIILCIHCIMQLPFVTQTNMCVGVEEGEGGTDWHAYPVTIYSFSSLLRVGFMNSITCIACLPRKWRDWKPRFYFYFILWLLLLLSQGRKVREQNGTGGCCGTMVGHGMLSLNKLVPISTLDFLLHSYYLHAVMQLSRIVIWCRFSFWQSGLGCAPHETEDRTGDSLSPPYYSTLVSFWWSVSSFRP